MTEINDVTSLTKSVNRIAKALDQEFEGKNLTESLDAIADYIEENGGGGGGAVIIHAIHNESTETWLLDKTSEELYALFEEGKPIFVEREETYEDNGFTHTYKSFAPIVSVDYITGEEEGVETENWSFSSPSGYDERFYGYWYGNNADTPPYWISD